MKRNIIIRRTSVSILAVLIFGAAPASAQERRCPSGYTSIERMSEAGRSMVGGVYRHVGNRACGRACGRIAELGGRALYDGARDVASCMGNRLQEIGRRGRRR